MTKSLRVLIIDDSEDDALLLVRHLKQEGLDPVADRVDTADALRSALLAFQWDVILCDVNMPRLDTVGALDFVRSVGIDVPFIVVSGSVAEERLVELMKAGAHDIIVKDQLSRLGPAIERELEEASVRRERKQAEAHLRVAIESISEGFTLYDAQDRLVICNETYRRIFSKSADLIVPGATFEEIVRGGAERGQYELAVDRVEEFVRERMALHRACGGPFEQKLSDGRWILIDERRTHDGGTVGIRTDITALKNAENALRTSEEQFRSAFETAPHGIALVGLDGRWLMVNRAVTEMLGYDERELLGTNFQTVTHPDDIAADMNQARQVLDRKIQNYQLEKRYIRKDGEIVPALLSVSLVRDSDGMPLHFVSQLLDLSARKDAEEKLRQAQKMEAVGQLTGGVAHDFNNLLTVMMGNAHLLERALAGNEDLQRKAGAIAKAAKRGADLTHRLLAFSRKQALNPAIVDLGEVVEGMLDLLRRTLGEAVEVKTSVAAKPCRVFVDPGELEHALLNLAVNAKDAMSGGGTITIGIADKTLSEPDVQAGADIAPGAYVALTVSDTGTGIAKENLPHIFEPFFTTKEVGKGTGLGLSMVYGFAKQSGGEIHVESEMGRGTTFRLYLPKALGVAAVQNDSQDREESAANGHETILVVEDEPDVRAIAVLILQDLGYRVIQAENGPDALAKLEEQPGVDLLFTDMIMPGGMTGYELAAKARDLWPGLKVLYTSGYTDDALASAGKDIHLVRKPYQDTVLTKEVRGALARRSR